MQWFYSTNGVQQGPVNWAALATMASLGQLKPTDLLWSDGQADWQPAASFPDLVFSNRPSDENLKWIIPIGVSGWAIASSYLGLFSVIAIGAPFALLTGILALRDINRNPGRGGKGRAIFGIVMGSVFLLAYGYLAVVLTMNSRR